MKDSLKNKLSALTQEDAFENKAMVLGPSGTPEAMALILNAIDNTITSRAVKFMVDQSSISFHVNNRRLMCLLSATADLSAEADLIEKPLSDKVEDTLENIGAVLINLISMEGTLTLERTIHPPFDDASRTGVAVAKLTEIWEIVEDS